MARQRTLVLALVAAATLFGGCVYRPDIQQGNLLSVKDVEQVTPGMSRSQVRFLLGTPMVSDPFAPHRWDYIYRMQYGRSRSVDSAHFIVFFEGDMVTRVEMLDALESARPQAGEKNRRRNNAGAPLEGGANEPPAPPSIAQPGPEAPRPSGG